MLMVVVDMLMVLYMVEFTSVLAQTKRDLFLTSIEDVVEVWTSKVSYKNRNYYHLLAVKSPLLLEKHRSIGLYSSDITESLVHVIKMIQQNHSNHGGLHKMVWKQVLE